jgi:adhesin transport system membrane fusion protein
MSISQHSADLTRQRLLLPSLMIAIFLSAIGAGVLWASMSKVVEASQGQGRVVPAGRVKIVQTLDGGIVNSILATEGQKVSEGDALVVIDATRAGAAFGEKNSAITQLEITSEWLSAMLEDRQAEFAQSHWPKRMVLRAKGESEALRQEHSAHLAALDQAIETKRLEVEEYEGQLKYATQALDLAKERHALIAKLVTSGAAARDTLLSARSALVEADGKVQTIRLALPRLRAAQAESRGRRTEALSAFRSKLSARLSETQTRLDQLREGQASEQDRMARAVLRAPTDGIVKTIHPASSGEVLQPAQPVVEILPADDDLLVRVEIDPRDIAFIAPGLPATIRLTAYDYAAFGDLEGDVVRIGVDSVTDEQGKSFFPVDVRVHKRQLPDGRDLPILPGMVAQVYIATGEKTVLNYLVKPIHRTVTTAFRER